MIRGGGGHAYKHTRTHVTRVPRERNEAQGSSGGVSATGAWRQIAGGVHFPLPLPHHVPPALPLSHWQERMLHGHDTDAVSSVAPLSPVLMCTFPPPLHSRAPLPRTRHQTPDIISAGSPRMRTVIVKAVVVAPHRGDTDVRAKPHRPLPIPALPPSSLLQPEAEPQTAGGAAATLPSASRGRGPRTRDDCSHIPSPLQPKARHRTHVYDCSHVSPC